MLSYGVDVGSTYIKIAGLDSAGEVVDSCVIQTLVEQEKRVLEYLEAREVGSLTATGYGRNLIKEALGARAISEIQAHARGACHFFKECSLVIDLGGQDSKVIEIEQGCFTDFRMNDKCAAGTGRFLEIAAERLGMEIGAFGPLCAQSKKEVEISSMCAVFAESELISLLARQERVVDIGAGVHRSVASRLSGMAAKFRTGGCVVFTGGGALNPFLHSLLQSQMGVPVLVPPYPQLIGAIGAALS